MLTDKRISNAKSQTVRYKLKDSNGLNALLFRAYTFVRPGEPRKAGWPEIDFDKKIWKIPAIK